ncbi:MAG: choice-of-anchor D domain-containing protein [Candidatus Angelobacter sp.]
MSTTVNWACAVLCVLVLFCSAAQALPSVTGFLVNGVAATSGPIGANLTIQGSGFGTTQGFSTATLNGIAVAGNGVKPVSWSNTAIVVVVPTNATSGPVVVKVSSTSSNSVNFTVSPAINSLSPASGDHGTSVTITGSNFATQTSNTVKFNGTATTPTTWSSTKIIAPVPFTTSGKVVVTVSGAQSNGVNFTIAAPPPAGTLRTGTYFVNRTDDPGVPVDASSNPLLAQFCQNTSNTDTSSPCSLREAVVEANGDANDTSTSPDTIMLGSATYHLSIAGTGTINATTGHLDITNPVTIVGTGASTIIQGDATLQDQIFLIDAAEEGSIGFPVAFSNLVIQGGHANPAGLGVTSGGGMLWEAGTDGTGQLKLTNVNLNGNTATDPGSPGLDDGGAMALFNTAPVTTPAQVTITSGSTIANNQALDAGGGVALKGAISLTLSNSTVSGNKALGGGIQQGGGLFVCVCNNAPTGATSSPSLIQSSTISGNVAGSGSLGEGGALWTNQALTINQGSVISGNSSGGAGGGIATALAGATDQVVISSSSITGNSTSGSGGGVEIDANSKANLQLSFNRIVGNSASGGGSGVSNLGTGTVSATDNWWGCNQGPGLSPCDLASGSVSLKNGNNQDAWITLRNVFSTSQINVANTVTVTASVLQDNNNNPLPASNLGTLVNLPATGSIFSNPVSGTLSNVQNQIQSNGQATATFTATAAGTGSVIASLDQATVTPTITITAPVASLSPTSLSFGNQNVGTTSGAQTVTLSNTGTASLAIASIAASGDFAQTNNCGTSLAVNAICAISVTFTPAATGSRTGTVQVIDNAAGSPQSVSLSGTGTAPTAILSPTGLNFGNQQVGTTSGAQTVTLSNTGTAPLAIASIAASGDFAQTNNCGTSLAVGVNCTITVTFTPTAIGSRSGIVSMTDNATGSPQTVSLSGTGTAPVVSLSPTSRSWSQHVDTTSAPGTFTLSNTGNGPLTITGFAIDGPDFTLFNNTCGSTLAAGASCTFQVSFTPGFVGIETGSVTVSDNAAGSPQSVSLNGTGVAGTCMLVTPNGVVPITCAQVSPQPTK